MTEYIVDIDSRFYPTAARNREILRLHNDGATFVELSERFNLTRERIRQICHHAERSERNLAKALEGLEEIVRCRDCTHCVNDELHTPKVRCRFHDNIVVPDGYCAWGMRRDT